MNGVVLATAWAVDRLFGEPPVGHPVRGMGSVLIRAKRWNAGASLSESGRRVAGALLLAGGAWGSWRVGRRLAPADKPLQAGLAISATLSLNELLAAGRRVRRHLERGDLASARASLGRDLVGRDTSELTESEVAGAAVQSLAENLNDAFVAPLLWATVAGGGAAWAYRFVNTADAVLGYRTPELASFGWASARADDLLGWLPARLSAASIVLAAPLVGASAEIAVRALRTSAGATPSPNGGWPMAAAAGALGVCLEKRGAYVLHGSGSPPGADTVRRAERLIEAAGVVAVGILAGITGVDRLTRRRTSCPTRPVYARREEPR